VNCQGDNAGPMPSQGKQGELIPSFDFNTGFQYDSANTRFPPTTYRGCMRQTLNYAKSVLALLNLKNAVAIFSGSLGFLLILPCLATPLTDAVRDGHYEQIESLIRQGVAVDAVDNRLSPSALAIAVSKNASLVAHLLIQNGAKVNAIHPGNRCSLLQNAAATPMQGNIIKMVALLVESNADLHAVTPTCGTALMSAARTGHSEIAKYLLKQGADVNQLAIGSSALMEAILNRQFSVAEELLNLGADPNLPILDGATALHLTAEKMPGFFSTLLNNGGHFTTDNQDRGVLTFAIMGGNETLVTWLFKLPWPQAQLDDALRMATRKNHLSWENSLLTLGAKPTFKKSFHLKE